MKKLKAILLIPFIIMGLTLTVVAQSQILAFHFNGQNGKQTTSTSTTTNANLLTSTMSRGAGALANSSSTNTINANMGKTFQLTESKQLTIRVDATNILNHPSPNPVTTITNDPFGSDFGEISGKGGSPRNFQASVRLSF